MTYDNDYVLCECDLEPLRDLVALLEETYPVSIVKEPSVCLTMIRAEDSLDKQEFYLGEALTTECEVVVGDHVGHGVCLGDEPVRGYCLAFVDALVQSPDGAREVAPFIDAQRSIIAARETEEFNLVMRTKVDFKLMEEE
jgi:alpha-D-ribose 1-methylphosphonate 5-triphosphate synthase subunit PhnG